MAKFTEKCPHCGNFVEGKIKRSTTSKATRNVIKKGGMKTVLGVAGSVIPGFGNVAGFVAGAAIDAFLGDNINKAVDNAADMFVKDTNYSFMCPKCGHTWISTIESTNHKFDNNYTKNDNYKEELDFSSWDSIAVETLAIITNELNCDVDNIHNDTFIRELGATTIQCTGIKVDLENTFAVEIPSDFLDKNTVSEIIDAIFNCKNPSVVSDDKDSDDEQSGCMDRKLYEIHRLIVSVQHYCLCIINSLPEGDLDYTLLVKRINDDTKAGIAAWQIKDDDRMKVVNKLVDRLLSNRNIPNALWHNIVKALPQPGDNFDNYIMEVYDSVYVEDSIEPFGNTLIGVNISGTINVGDRIVLCTYNDEYYETQVVWIEMLDKKVASSESGDTIGMGINIDLREMSDSISRVYKYDEFYTESEEEDEDNEENEKNKNKDADANNIDEDGFTEEEQEYLDELKEILSDGEISPRERRLLEKIRVQLGISEERAAELENSLTILQLTEEEQEYLDEYKEIAADGEITDKERRLLDKILKMNGISAERAREIEASVKR